MLRIAVLGVGRIGRMHAENIAAHPRTALAGIYDPDEVAAREVAGKLDAARFDSAGAVFASADVDAVLIASATATHVEFIEMAVAAGKPVLCEKPIDLSLDRVDSCAKKIAGSNVPIMLGFVRRFDGGHRALAEAVRKGDIGELHQVTITSRDPDIASDAYIEASGGIFRDMTIHDFDMARYVTGEEVAAVTATGSRLVKPDLMQRCDDYDTVSIVMETVSGKQCTIINSRRAVYGYDQRVEAFGSAGMLVSENHPVTQLRSYGADFTNRGAPLMDFFIERYGAAFRAEIDAFADSIEKGVPPEVGFEDGRAALVLAEAAIRSVKERRTIMVRDIA